MPQDKTDDIQNDEDKITKQIKKIMEEDNSDTKPNKLNPLKSLAL